MPNRILLADDHAIVRQGLKALLEREGYAVVAEAGDGQEALREARERCPDVAVLDVSMPLLHVSFKTAESHRTRIMKKTDIHETAGLVRYAVRRGLIQP